MTFDEAKKRLRAANTKLRAAKCTCIFVQHDWNAPKHDPFDMRCPKAIAEAERDHVLGMCGIYL